MRRRTRRVGLALYFIIFGSLALCVPGFDGEPLADEGPLSAGSAGEAFASEGVEGVRPGIPPQGEQAQEKQVQTEHHLEDLQEFVVKLAHPKDVQTAGAWFQSLGVSVKITGEEDGTVWLVQMPPGKAREEALRTLESSSDVAYLQPNYTYQLHAVPNDPYYRHREFPQWGNQAIQMDEVWEEFMRAAHETVKVAVIDSGADRFHPDLRESVAWELAANTLERGAPVQDEHGHGTHVTGIIAATVNNKVGIAGVAGFPFVQVIPVKAMDATGEGNSYSIARGVDYALEQGASIINLSIGGEENDRIIQDAVRKAIDAGVMVVVAAGNDGIDVKQFTPGNVEEALTVGAVDEQEHVAEFSNYGETIDLVAPGVSIVSTYIKGEGRLDSDYEVMSGTSTATPFVTATAALMKSVYPQMTVEEMQAAMTRTALDLGANGWDTRSGFGLVQVKEALQQTKELKELARLQNVFPDIGGSGVETEIRTLYRDGVIDGYPDGTFRPALPVTRAQFAKILTLSAGWETVSPTAPSEFTDVTVPEQQQYVGALVREGVTTGVSEDRFDPYGKITRQQMASFFIRALGLEAFARQHQPELLKEVAFTDEAEIDPSHLANVALAARIGFITGIPNEDGTFRFQPRALAKRQHVARLSYEFKYHKDQYTERAAQIR